MVCLSSTKNIFSIAYNRKRADEIMYTFIQILDRVFATFLIGATNFIAKMLTKCDT